MGLNYNPYSLEGRTILVTGASSGIGRGTAIECSKLGANVILVARNEERLQSTLQQLDTSNGQTHSMVSADLSSQEELGRLVSSVAAVDGLVLCAGIGKTLPFPFCDRESFNQVFEINLFSHVELLRLMVKKKKLVKDSSVVFVGSVAGYNSYMVGNGIYSAAKAGINAMMKTAAKELASKKIRVNSVSPAMVNTNLISRGTITAEQYEKDMQRYPLKRYGEPEDIAFGIIYLLSTAASWITGQTIVIDGGITA